MEQKRWFLFVNETVKGPFSAERVLQMLSSNSLKDEHLIWWKGQRDWVTITYWKAHLNEIFMNFKTDLEKSVWYLELSGLQQGPYYFDEIKNFLKQPKAATDCKLWTAGMTDWQRPFEMPEISQELGLARRKHFRAPIKGDLVLQKNGVKFSMKVASISEGGVGFKDQEGLNAGDVVSVLLKSPMLVSSISSKAKIVYTSNNGNTGLQFLNLPSENHTNIVMYIKQFQTTAPIL